MAGGHGLGLVCLQRGVMGDRSNWSQRKMRMTRRGETFPRTISLYWHTALFCFTGLSQLARLQKRRYKRSKRTGPYTGQKAASSASAWALPFFSTSHMFVSNFSDLHCVCLYYMYVITSIWVIRLMRDTREFQDKEEEQPPPKAFVTCQLLFLILFAC